MISQVVRSHGAALKPRVLSTHKRLIGGYSRHRAMADYAEQLQRLANTTEPAVCTPYVGNLRARCVYPLTFVLTECRA